MTYDELAAHIGQILPNATFGRDNEGQLIIYTDLQETDDDIENVLRPFIPADELDTLDVDHSQAETLDIVLKRNFGA